MASVELRAAGPVLEPGSPFFDAASCSAPRPSPSPPCLRAPYARPTLHISRSFDSVPAVFIAAAGGLFAATVFITWVRVVGAALASARQDLLLQEQHLQRHEQEQELAKQRMPCNYCEAAFPGLRTTSQTRVSYSSIFVVLYQYYSILHIILRNTPFNP